MRYFTFNGTRSDSFFLTNKIELDILPPIDFDIVKVSGRSGGVSFKSRLDVRKFKIDVTLLGQTEAGLAQSRRDIAKWLFTDVEKDLIFSDEPNITYKAKVSGDTGFTQLPMMGETSIEFVAVDPFGYGTVKTVTISSNPQTINNTGTATAYPVITFKPTAANLSGFAIKNEATNKTFTLTGTFTQNKTYQIDMKASSVTDVATGARLMPQVRIDSDFWDLQAGNNSISYTAASATTVTLAYTERFY